ncbi:MAG: hypothetical protein JNL58_18305 [Planctomyces sp.]|nr:hypothetical protein [Planctomyces sp.]
MMITAIDFGTCWIRSAFRNPAHRDRLSVYAERAEYALIPNTEKHRQLLEEQSISIATCDNSLAILGNQINQVKWLSRLPSTPLLSDGIVPIDDPPARQMLNVLVNAVLPAPEGSMNLCAFTVPGSKDRSEQSRRNREFLSRLIEMKGYEPVEVGSAEAAVLAIGLESSFTGIAVVMGAETTEICISRLGIPLVSATLPLGSNWIDAEIAKQFKMHAWDGDGQCYIDLEAARSWKQTSMVSIRHPMGDREQTFARLYAVVMDRITRSISQMLKQPSIVSALGTQRLAVMLAGGPTRTTGFANLLTERLIEHELADRLLSIRTAQDPDLAVVRGALVFAELEASHRKGQEVAA